MISEVSAVVTDDSEPSESGLKGPNGSFNSTGSLMDGERLHEVPVKPDGALNNPHSNNTYSNNVPLGTNETLTLYEKHHEKPFEQRLHDGEKANMDMKNAFQDNVGENMNLNLRCNQSCAPKFVDNEFSEAISNLTSELIGLESLSIAFKNNRDNQFGFLPKYIPESSVYIDAIPLDYCGGINQYNGDLPSDNITSKTDYGFFPKMGNISPLYIKSPEFNESIPLYSQFPIKDFLPESYKTQGFENTYFPKINIHNDMPLWNSTQMNGSDLNKSDKVILP